MFTILLHSSKTMRAVDSSRVSSSTQAPVFIAKAEQLNGYLKKLNVADISAVMKVSEAKAKQTYHIIQTWSPNDGLAAIDAFLGDIYSGLQSSSFSKDDRAYANTHLFILSGLYGVLRALDSIQPYRFEMAYKLPGQALEPVATSSLSLYDFWGNSITTQLPAGQDIINVSSVEYTKAVFPHLKNHKDFAASAIITPRFLTISPKTGEPTFVTVHAKIARGAFAHWLIKQRIKNRDQLNQFNELGYAFEPSLSSPDVPVYVAQEFKGIGLSVRLS